MNELTLSLFFVFSIIFSQSNYDPATVLSVELLFTLLKTAVSEFVNISLIHIIKYFFNVFFFQDHLLHHTHKHSFAIITIDIKKDMA